jgi:hypothetical protein
MVRLFVFIVLGVLVFQGCSRQRPEIKFPVEQQVKTEVILSDLRIRMAGSIFITDSLLILQEPNTPEKYLKYYHLGRKELLAEFGQTGKGPGQMITPYLCYVDTYSSQVYLFDPNLRKMHVFDVAQLSEKPDTVINLNTSLNKGSEWLSHVTQPSGNVIYGGGMLRNGYLAAVDTKTGEIRYFGKYPLKSKHSNNLNISDACNALLILSPDKKHLVLATSRFGYLACYEPDKEKTRLSWEHQLSVPKYKMDGQRVVFTSQNETGTMDLALTNDKIFLLYQGSEFRHYHSRNTEDLPRIVMVFSMDGKPLAKYYLDHPATRITVDHDENIYCLTTTPEYNLVKLKIN